MLDLIGCWLCCAVRIVSTIPNIYRLSGVKMDIRISDFDKFDEFIIWFSNRINVQHKNEERAKIWKNIAFFVKLCLRLEIIIFTHFF